MGNRRKCLALAKRATEAKKFANRGIQTNYTRTAMVQIGQLSWFQHHTDDPQ